MENESNHNFLGSAKVDTLKQIDKQSRVANLKKEKRKEILEFKGIHFKKEKQVPNHEYGAHFNYQELYSILSQLEHLNIERNDDNCEPIESKEDLSKKHVNLEHAPSDSNKKGLMNILEIEAISNKNENIQASRTPKCVILPNINLGTSEPKKNEQLESMNEMKIWACNEIRNKISSVVDESESSSDKLGYIETDPSSNYNALKTETNGNFQNNFLQSNYPQTSRDNPYQARGSCALQKRTIVVNHKTETFEFVLPKIDTGLKKKVSALKESTQTGIGSIKLAQKNKLNVFTESSENPKQYKAFNQNIINLYRPQPDQKLKSLNEIKSSLPNLHKGLNPINTLLGQIKSK